MSLDQETGAESARGESYRAAARAAVAELDEIEAVTLALQARIAKLGARARSLTSLLDVLQDVVPDAVPRREPWVPTQHDGVAESEASALPRRRRRREAEQPAEGLAELAVLVSSESAPDFTPEDVMRGGLGNGRHTGAADDVFATIPAGDVEAWG